MLGLLVWAWMGEKLILRGKLEKDVNESFLQENLPILRQKSGRQNAALIKDSGLAGQAYEESCELIASLQALERLNRDSLMD